MGQLKIIPYTHIRTNSSIDCNTLTGTRRGIDTSKFSIENSIDIELGILNIWSAVIFPGYCDMVPFGVRYHGIPHKETTTGFDANRSGSAILSLNSKGPFLSRRITPPRNNTHVLGRAVEFGLDPSGNRAITGSRNSFVTDDIDLIIDPIHRKGGRGSRRNRRKISGIPKCGSRNRPSPTIRGAISSGSSRSFFKSPVGDQIRAKPQMRESQ